MSMGVVDLQEMMQMHHSRGYRMNNTLFWLNRWVESRKTLEKTMQARREKNEAATHLHLYLGHLADTFIQNDLSTFVIRGWKNISLSVQ